MSRRQIVQLGLAAGERPGKQVTGLEDDVGRLGAEGVVIAGLQMQVRTRDCPAAVGRRDHIVEVTLTGTAIAGFSRAGRRHAGPRLTVMSLDPRRRGRM